MNAQKRMARKALAILLTLAMVVCMFPMTVMADTTDAAGTDAQTATYTDTANHWAKDSIERWSVYGVVGGMGNGTFNPNGVMTRGQAATLFANLLNLGPATNVTEFADVDSGDWYADPIARVAEAGIMNGVGGGKMDPNGLVTREQFFVMMARALGIEPQANTSGAQADGHDYSAGYINALTDMGFVKGDGNGVNALADINRASVMALLDQTISTYANKAGEIVTAEGGGVALIVAVGVTLSGEAVIVAVAGGAEGGSGVTLQDAEIGRLNVMTDADVNVMGESKVKDITVAEGADGADLTIGANSTVGTIESAADNATVENRGTVTGTITTTGENATVKNVGEAGAIAAKGENANVQNTGKVNGNITSAGTVNNSGAVGGDVTAEGKVTNTGTVAGTVAEGNKPTTENTESTGGSGGGHSGGGEVLPEGVYKVNWDVQGNGTITIDNRARMGETVTISAEPDRGYSFESVVVKTADGTEVPLTEVNPEREFEFSMPGEAVYVTLKFSVNWYDVAVTPTAIGNVSVDKDEAKYRDTVTITVSDYDGYRIADVYYCSSDDSFWNEAEVTAAGTYTFSMPDEDVIVHVEFIPADKFIVSLNQPVNGDIDIERPTYELEGGETIKISIYHDNEYKLENLTVKTAGNAVIALTPAFDPAVERDSYTFVMPEADVVVSGTFVEDLHSVTAKTVSYGSITLDKTQAKYGDEVTVIRVTPESGYGLWDIGYRTASDSDDLNLENGRFWFSMPDEDVTVVPEFREAYAVTRNPAVNGTYKVYNDWTDEENPASICYEEDVVVVVNPAEGYQFDEIAVITATGGAVSVTTNEPGEEYEFEMPDEAVTVTVTFAAIPTLCDISVECVDLGHNVTDKGSVTVAAEATPGTDVELSASATEEDYYLVNVDVKDASNNYLDVSRTATGFAFTMPRYDVTVIAMFDNFGIVTTAVDALTTPDASVYVVPDTAEVIDFGFATESIYVVESDTTVGEIAVPNGKVLVIPEGVTLTVVDDSVHECAVIVDGYIYVLGTLEIEEADVYKSSSDDSVQPEIRALNHGEIIYDSDADDTEGVAIETPYTLW